MADLDSLKGDPDPFYLTSCRICGGVIAARAQSCVHCGYPRTNDDPGEAQKVFAILFWGWQVGMLALAAYIAIWGYDAPVRTFDPSVDRARKAMALSVWGGALVDLVMVWGAGSVALASCRWMAGWSPISRAPGAMPTMSASSGRLPGEDAKRSRMAREPSSSGV